MPFYSEKTITIDNHSACSVFGAVVEALKKITQELNILKISKERDLTKIERSMLPYNLRKFTQEELQEQIDPWCSWVMDLNYWAEEFDPEKFPEMDRSALAARQVKIEEEEAAYFEKRKVLEAAKEEARMEAALNAPDSEFWEEI